MTMNNFTHIKRELETYFNNLKLQKAYYIQHGYRENWDEKRQNDKGLETNLTDLRFHQYKSGKISREQAVEYATKRAFAALDKELKKKFERIDRIAKAPNFDFIRIEIEFKQSKSWGMCPVVCVYVNGEKFKGRASGCGYDKKSTAVAQALNQSDSILKMLYTLKEKGLTAGKSDKSNTAVSGRCSHNICGYGSGYAVEPYFENGVGLNSIWEMFKKCGYTVTEHDGYYIIKKDIEPLPF